MPYLQEYLMENNQKLQGSMTESQKITDERYQINEELKSLYKAKKIINNDPEYSKNFKIDSIKFKRLMGYYENRVWERRTSIASSISQAENKKENNFKHQHASKEKKQSITSEILEKEDKIVKRINNL